jgi:DNA primase
MSKEKKPFVDFPAIRARLTMEMLLEHYGVLHTFKRTSKTLSGPCPIHKGHNKTQFRVNTEKNLWNCFSECKHGGNTLGFIERMENCSVHDAALKACEWFKIPITDVKSSRTDDEPEETAEHAAKPIAKAVVKPPLDDGKPNPPLPFALNHLQREHPYLTQERGLTLETIIDFGMGYCAKGTMTGRIAIPIRNVIGEIVAYAGRWPGEPPDEDTEKYKLPKDFKKMLELFNIDRAIKEPPDKPLVIVEGFFGVFHIHQCRYRKVTGLMGSSLSDAHLELIDRHTTPDCHVILMLDEDNSGRAGRDEAAARISKIRFVKTIQFQKEGTQPEHLSTDELKQILGGAL